MSDSRLGCRAHPLSVGSPRAGAHLESRPPTAVHFRASALCHIDLHSAPGPWGRHPTPPLTGETAQTSGSLVLMISGHRRALLADHGHTCVRSR